MPEGSDQHEGKTITAKKLMIKDIKADTDRIYINKTRRKNFALLTNIMAVCLIKVRKLLISFTFGRFSILLYTARKDSIMIVQCTGHDY